MWTCSSELDSWFCSVHETRRASQSQAERESGRSGFKWQSSYSTSETSRLTAPSSSSLGRGCVLSTSEIYSSLSYFVPLPLLNRAPSPFLPPPPFQPSTSSHTHSLTHTHTHTHTLHTDAPLIYAGLHGANRSLTFCLTVQCMVFPMGSIKL